MLSDTKFLIHGGYNGNNALSDTFVFDTGEQRFSGVGGVASNVKEQLFTLKVGKGVGKYVRAEICIFLRFF